MGIETQSSQLARRLERTAFSVPGEIFDLVSKVEPLGLPNASSLS